MKIVIVDDNETFRTGFKLFLQEKYNYEIIAEFDNANDIINSNYLACTDIILMDIVMPGIDGIKASKILLKKNKNINIIIITMHTEKVFLEQLINTGIKGCIFKDTVFNNISKAIDNVVKGKFYFPKEVVL